jgi:hypothetical protein
MTVIPGEPIIKPEDFLPESRNVSNSEVTTFLSCKRMYDFAFIENLEPIETSKPLSRGTTGHGMFEAYIKARLNGASHELAMKEARSYVARELAAGTVSIEVAGEAQFLFERYQEYHAGWPEWELLGTEERVDLKLTDTLSIAIRYDLMIRDRKTDRVLMGDWKFTYDFWSASDHAINPQMPKYLAVMRANNYQIDGGFIFEIRTRVLGKEKAADARNLWRRTNYLPILPQMSNMMKQHIIVSKEIEEHRALDPQVRREYHSMPVLNKYGPCKYCAFTELCDSMNKGKKDLSVDIREGFKENSYSYNKTEEVGF